MNSIVIVGAGGFGREVAWLIERINQKRATWNIIGFIDDSIELGGQSINGYPVLGHVDEIGNYEDCYVICAVGASRTRESVINKIKGYLPSVKFATLIDPSVDIAPSNIIGEGTIICAYTVLTVNIEIGKHVIINLCCTVGHDAIIDDYSTLYPSVNVSGNVHLHQACEIGTGAQIIQKKNIGNYSIVGAGAVVVKDIPEKCTAVGIPANPIKYFEV